jgi:hypothetical protein
VEIELVTKDKVAAGDTAGALGGEIAVLKKEVDLKIAAFMEVSKCVCVCVCEGKRGWSCMRVEDEYYGGSVLAYAGPGSRSTLAWRAWLQGQGQACLHEGRSWPSGPPIRPPG